MPFNLSARERLVISCSSQGLTDKEMARMLDISVRTISTYWDRIRVKMNSASRTESVAMLLNEEAEKSARKAVLAMQDRQDLLEDSEGFVLFSLDLHGKIKDWNKGILRVLGFSKEEFVGCDFAIIFTPADAKAGLPAEELKLAYQTGKSINGHYHILHSGAKIWIEGTLLAHLDDEGNLRGFSIILHDETVRKDQEREIEALREKILSGRDYEGFVVQRTLETSIDSSCDR